MYNIINYWKLSHIMCLKSHWISETKIIFWWKNEQLVRFGTRFNVFFKKIPNRCTLKSFKIKCNLTNKKLLPHRHSISGYRAGFFARFYAHKVWPIAVWSFVLYERPILGDHPKAHSEKHCGFHEKQQFSLKSSSFH